MDLDNVSGLISCFMAAVQEDGRIGPTHIAVYCSLWFYWIGIDCPQRFNVYSHQIMPMSKIRASSTYYGCIGDLHEFGYIRYRPSYNRNRPSEIILNIMVDR